MTAALSNLSSSACRTNTFPLHAIRSSNNNKREQQQQPIVSSEFREPTFPSVIDTTEFTANDAVSHHTLIIDSNHQLHTATKMRSLPLFTFESLIRSSNHCTAAAEPAPRPWLPCDSTTGPPSEADEPFYCDYATTVSTPPTISSSKAIFSIGDDDVDLSTWFENRNSNLTSSRPSSSTATTAFASSQRLTGTFSAEAVKKLGKLARASIHRRCISTPESAWTSSLSLDEDMQIAEDDDENAGSRSRHSSLPSQSSFSAGDDVAYDDEHPHAVHHHHVNQRRFSRHHGHRKLIDTKPQRACPFDARHLVHTEHYERHLHECQAKRFETYVRKRFRKVVTVAKAERQASVARMPSIAEEDGDHHHHPHHDRPQSTIVAEI